MSKFKIGDRVILKDTPYYMQNGKRTLYTEMNKYISNEFTVKSTDSDGDVYLKEEPVEDLVNVINETCLELVEDENPLYVFDDVGMVDYTSATNLSCVNGTTGSLAVMDGTDWYTDGVMYGTTITKSYIDDLVGEPPKEEVEEPKLYSKDYKAINYTPF